MSDKKRKLSKAYYKDFGKKSKRGSCLEIGMKGFLVTSTHKERECVREAYNLLNEYQSKASDENSEKKETETCDAEEELQQEIEALKEKETLFQQVQTNVKHCLFIKSKIENPNELVYSIIEDLRSTKKQKTCNLLRMIPVSRTCQASADNIVQSVMTEVEHYFKVDSDSSKNKYTIIYKVRNNNKISRTDIIPKLTKEIKDKLPDFTPVYKEGYLFILINVVQTKCCISIVSDYEKNCKLNLTEIVLRDNNK